MPLICKFWCFLRTVYLTEQRKRERNRKRKKERERVRGCKIITRSKLLMIITVIWWAVKKEGRRWKISLLNLIDEDVFSTITFFPLIIIMFFFFFFLFFSYFFSSPSSFLNLPLFSLKYSIQLYIHHHHYR